MNVSNVILPVLPFTKLKTTNLENKTNKIHKCSGYQKSTIIRYVVYTWQWWKSLRSWLLKCQRKFFLSPKVRWHLLHLKGRSLLWTTLMCRSRSPRRVKRASHKSQACGRSWAWVFKLAFSEPGFIMRWQDRHSILAPSPSPTTMVRTWIRPSPSSSNSSKSSAFYTHAKCNKKRLSKT